MFDKSESLMPKYYTITITTLIYKISLGILC